MLGGLDHIDGLLGEIETVDFLEEWVVGFKGEECITHPTSHFANDVDILAVGDVGLLEFR